MLKEEHTLLIPFIKEPWKKRTFREIKKLCHKTSDSYVYTILKKYVKEGILSEESIGNIILYSLNLAEITTQLDAGFIAENIGWKSRQLPFDVIYDVIKKIPTPYYTFIITGSYAKNKQTQDSDLDIVIIVDNKSDTQHIYAQIHFICDLSIPKGHPYVFKKSEFLEMLTNNEFNYGKEIAKNNLILHGASEYYTILNEAMQNGLNDKKLY